ncbi:hypothetical protein PLICRDRAFT_474023 [Plicaturopsis crispa FD-325 SS-3]|nr:hypothetical protein PLICRDRAFT_474023 [Plicaturopsis crispa FD-325 SS-3]
MHSPPIQSPSCCTFFRISHWSRSCAVCSQVLAPSFGQQPPRSRRRCAVIVMGINYQSPGRRSLSLLTAVLDSSTLLPWVCLLLPFPAVPGFGANDREGHSPQSLHLAQSIPCRMSCARP